MGGCPRSGSPGPAKSNPLGPLDYHASAAVALVVSSGCILTGPWLQRLQFCLIRSRLRLQPGHPSLQCGAMSTSLDDIRPIELREIREARQRIANTILRTPLVSLELGPDYPDIRLKLENLQPINAYKLRGA